MFPRRTGSSLGASAPLSGSSPAGCPLQGTAMETAEYVRMPPLHEHAASLASPGATPDPYDQARMTQADFMEDETPRMLGSAVFSMHGWGDLLPLLSSALPLLLLSYSSCVSYAQLIVVGSPVSSSIVATMHLVSAGLTGLILPLRSQCPLIVPSADITVTMFYQLVVHDVVRKAGEAGVFSEGQVAATALLALPVNTVLMSLIFWWVGRQKATVAVSYLPYPVVAGFLGTIGWAIFAGSFSVIGGSQAPPL